MNIKSWFKFFGLSFFSDKIAREAPKRGFTAVGLALLLSFLFLACGYIAADIVPFSTHYENAGQYKEFVQNAFDGEIDIVIENKAAHSDNKINTYVNGSDGKFIKNGYNLIVDTRPAKTFIKFSQTAVKGNTEISYEDYLKLSDEERKAYKIKTVYTDEQIELTEESVNGYGTYLKGAGEEAAADFEKLDKEQLKEQYNEELYCLFVKYYYTDATSVLYGAKAPVLRDYYYKNFITGGNAYYFYLFGDMCAGSFKTDGGVPVVFGGYFNKCADGQINDMGGFIKQTYYDTARYASTTYFVSAISQLPALIFIPLILALITFGAGKLCKGRWENTYGGCFKIVNSFVWVSALLTALITFAFGFMASARLMYSLMPLIFAGILAVRITVFCILSAIKTKIKPEDNGQTNINDDIFGGNL